MGIMTYDIIDKVSCKLSERVIRVISGGLLCHAVKCFVKWKSFNS
jgi:hypothetical protein